MLHFPCAAGVGSVVEVDTACRHGNVLKVRNLVKQVTNEPDCKNKEAVIIWEGGINFTASSMSVKISSCIFFSQGHSDGWKIPLVISLSIP